VEPTSNCCSASGASEFAVAAAVMQAIESQTLILYHSDLRGQWPEAAAARLAARLPYAKRLEVRAHSERAAATLAGVALALRALETLTGRSVSPAQLGFPQDGKPRLLPPGGADFSISHSGPWVGCAAVAHGSVGFDVEFGGEARLAEWAAREAALKAVGAQLAEACLVTLEADAAVCRGQRLHAQPLGLFAGAAAWVMTSVRVARIEARSWVLAELFAP
jgi:4'-phosphopantetheinyl transferase EntD